MPVLNEISVGSVLYQLIEGAPTHSATAGVVALDKESGKYFFYNNTGWEILITPNYGGIYFTGSSVTTDTDSTTGAWRFDASTSIGGTSPGSYRNDPDMLGLTSSFNGSLRITDPSNIGRYLISTTTTFTNITDAHLIEVFPFIYPISSNTLTGRTISPTRGIASELMRSSTTFANFKMTVDTSFISEILPGRGISLAKRYRLPASATSGYRIENNSIQVLKLEDAVVTYVLDEEWSTGTFSTNSWTVVNDTTNRWVIGTAATASTGSYSAYISNNSGTSHTYGNTSNISHFYRNFTIPNQSGDFYLSFDWKSNGEDSQVDPSFYDFGVVVISLTTSTPVAGTQLTTAVANITQGGPTGSGRIGSTNDGKYNSIYGGADSFWRQELILLNNYKGLTRRLTFSWVNDNVTLGQPPFAVDNIKIFRRIYI